MSDISRGHIGVKKIVALSRQVAIQAQAWVTQNLFGPHGVVTATPTMFRQPTFANLPRRLAPQVALVATNLLLTTLAVTAADPFTPANTSLPERVAPQSYTAALEPAQPARFSLETLAQNPFTHSEWPNPIARPVVTEGMTGAKTAESVVVGDPFIVTEWPNPILRVPAPGGWTGNKTADAVLVDQPFTQIEWTNPVSLTRPVAPRFHRYAGEPVASGPSPFTQVDWPNPAPVSRWPFIAPAVDLLTTTLAPAPGPPFTQTDWPNPILRGPVSQQNAGRELEPWPFAQTEWPNPVVRRAAQPSREPGNLLETTLATAPPSFVAAWAKGANQIILHGIPT